MPMVLVVVVVVVSILKNTYGNNFLFLLAGRDTDLPSARQSMGMFHPKPHLSWPPIMDFMGINTSLPVTVPFINAATKGS